MEWVAVIAGVWAVVVTGAGVYVYFELPKRIRKEVDAAAHKTASAVNKEIRRLKFR